MKTSHSKTHHHSVDLLFVNTPACGVFVESFYQKLLPSSANDDYFSSFTSFTSSLNQIEYRADNLPTATTLGNGLQEVRSYDLQGRLTSQQLDVLLSRAYSYDDNGNILGIDTNNEDPMFQYDAVDRITNETGILDGALTYDANSNRLTQLLGGDEFAYDYLLNSNQLTKVGDTALTLDAAGNTLTDGAKGFAYNDRNQLETYKDSGTIIASYHYNFANLRTRKNLTSGDTNLYHYDLQGRRIQHDKNNHKHTSTIYLGWQPVAHIKHETNGDIKSITYLTGDQIGSPRLGTSQSKAIVWEWRADAFGSTEPNGDVDGDGQLINIENRLAGQFADEESGLRYNYFRYYDPETGRYLRSDPIGLLGGLNTYAYVGNNPLIYIDPYGLDTQFSVGISGTAFAGGRVSGGTSVTVSTDGTFSGTRAGVTFQGNGLVGAGAFAGVGVSGGVSHSDGSPTFGINTTTGTHGEANAGFGISGGAGVDFPDGGGFGVSGGGGRLGVGVGIMPAGFGPSTTTTIFTPSIGELFDALFGPSLPRQGSRYPDPMLDDCKVPGGL